MAKTLGVGRNTARRLIRSEGLVPIASVLPQPAPLPSVQPTIEKIDMKMLEKMYSRTSEPGSNKDFEVQIESIATDIATELGVRSRVDTVRLELAVSQYILYRRFYFQSMEASDKNYFGPYAKVHDKQVSKNETILVGRTLRGQECTEVLNSSNLRLKDGFLQYYWRKPFSLRNASIY